MANTRLRKIGFRRHMVDGDQIAKQKIPASIQSSFKPIHNTPTAEQRAGESTNRALRFPSDTLYARDLKAPTARKAFAVAPR